MNKLSNTKQLQEIVSLYNTNQLIRARDRALRLSRKYSKDTRVLSLIGAIYRSLGDQNLARKYFLKVLKIDQNDYSVYNNLGLIDFEALDFEEAKKSFLQAIELNQKAPTLYFNLANVYLEEKDYDKAEVFYKKSIALGYETFKLFYNLAKLYMALNDTLNAQKMFEKAASIDNTNPDLLFEYSLFCLSKKDYAAGFALYQHRYHEQKSDKQTHLVATEQLLKKGVDIQGKRVLLTDEQGFGDIIQFARYLPLFEQAGAIVFMQTKKLLSELLKKVFQVLVLSLMERRWYLIIICPYLMLLFILALCMKQFLLKMDISRLMRRIPRI